MDCDNESVYYWIEPCKSLNSRIEKLNFTQLTVTASITCNILIVLQFLHETTNFQMLINIII